jgi:hypothetical protein
MTVTSGPHTERMRANAEAGWFDAIANLERFLVSSDGGEGTVHP